MAEILLKASLLYLDGVESLKVEACDSCTAETVCLGRLPLLYGESCSSEQQERLDEYGAIGSPLRLQLSMSYGTWMTAVRRPWTNLPCDELVWGWLARMRQL